jgi:hypothetical protein
VHALDVALLDVGEPGAVERPAGLLAVVADRDRDEDDDSARGLASSGGLARRARPPAERRAQRVVVTVT